MNYPDSGTVSVTGKKTRFSSAALALLLGLTLALSGTAAMALGEPIPGIDIVVKKNPGGIPFTTQTGPDGAYQIKGLAPGSYDLSVAGKRIQTITVGANRSISGTLSREPGGKASITFNGSFVVLPTSHGTLAVSKEANNALMGVSTTRGTAPRLGGGDVKHGISDQGAASNLSSYGTAPRPPKDGDKTPNISGEANSALQEVSTTRGTAPRLGGNAGVPPMTRGKNTQEGGDTGADSSAAPGKQGVATPPKGGD